MISTIYHVVSLLGTAQRLLLGLYMEEMKNRTLTPGELSTLDFVPPELFSAAASMDRERSKMSPPPPFLQQLAPQRRPGLPHGHHGPAPEGHHGPSLAATADQEPPPIFMAVTEPPAPQATDPAGEVSEQDLPVFLVQDPNDVFQLIEGTKAPPETEPPLLMVTAPVTTKPPTTARPNKKAQPTLDVRLKYFGSTSTLRTRPSTRTTRKTTPRPSSTTRRKTTQTTATTPRPTTKAPTTEAPPQNDAAKECGAKGCGPATTMRDRGERACRQDADCDKGLKCMADNCVLDIECPKHLKFGKGPPEKCEEPTDPFNLPPSPIEKWFTKEVFYDLFPKGNIGHGPHKCSPYSYEAFVIAARYFPNFGGASPDNGYDSRENARRDLAAFFAHAVQETGENDASLYDSLKKKEEADACFYRGGFFNWFEGGPTSSFLPRDSPGYAPEDGETCISAGKYCASGAELDYWFPCNVKKADGSGAARRRRRFLVRRKRAKQGEMFKGCYFGRGAIQISYNYNYGQFQRWLLDHRIVVDLLEQPNLVMTKKDPPLAVLASLWFYMTPQPPKPAMHDIVMGTWEPGPENREAGYGGPLFGPTSLVINNECGGEDEKDPGGPGESRRIKAFKWFCDYFNVPVEEERLLTCKGMPKLLDGIRHPLSYQPDWTNTWKEQSCDCAPANYGGMLPFFDADHYPQRFADLNAKNRIRCIFSVYDNPSMYGMDNKTSACLNYPIPQSLRTQMSVRDEAEAEP